MLVRLFGKNFRSFKDEFELSMVAADLRSKEESQRGVIEVPIKGLKKPLRILRVAAIYGANASGKSTVLLAAQALYWLAVRSSRYAEPGRRIGQYTPFMLDATTRDAAVELGCDVVHNDSILRYAVTFTSEEILEEKLSLLNGVTESIIIDRTRDRKISGELFEVSEANRLYVKQMQPNVTVLAKLAQHGPQKGEESAQPYSRSLGAALRWRDYAFILGKDSLLGEEAQDRFVDDQDYREWTMSRLIGPADLGIHGVKAAREKRDGLRAVLYRAMRESRGGVEGKEAELNDPGEPVISFIHEGSDQPLIDFSQESAGTRKLFHLATDWWELAKESVTLFADELSASLHPRLLENLVRAVNEPSETRSNAQLIFTTHDTGLMEGQDGQPPALRRDQTYFTEKGPHGVSSLFSLAEFKDGARGVHNIRKRYLAGLYGGLPIIEKFKL